MEDKARIRKGEALSLSWSHIDVENKLITIDQTNEAKKDEDLFNDTKTYRSTRTFKITSRLMQQLNAHRVRQQDNMHRFKDFYKLNLDLVFCREDGSPNPKSTFFNAFRRVLNKAGMSNMKIHTLRHTFTVLMIKSEVDMKFIQEIIVHESMQITSDVYSHVSHKIETRLLDKFEKYIEEF